MEKFALVSENRVTRAIVDDFTRNFNEILDQTDVIIVGAGPSGLIAARDLARDGLKVLLIEANNYLGGGFWIGGYFMNGVTFRYPANEVLDELSVPYKHAGDGLYIAQGPLACSRLIASACEAGIKILNLTRCDDVIIREDNRVAGVVINWSPVRALPKAITCVDPVAIESKMVIDATGHDAWVVKALSDRNILKLQGFGPMWIEKSEDLLVQQTGQIHPGLIVTGMAVSTVFGIPRMGPTFGGMLLSGKKAALVAKEALAACV